MGKIITNFLKSGQICPNNLSTRLLLLLLGLPIARLCWSFLISAKVTLKKCSDKIGKSCFTLKMAKLTQLENNS